MEDITIFLKVTFVHRCFFTFFKLNDGEYYNIIIAQIVTNSLKKVVIATSQLIFEYSYFS